MTQLNLHRRLVGALADEWVPSTVVYGTDEPVGFDNPIDWANHVADVLLSLPDVAIVDPEDLKVAICVENAKTFPAYLVAMDRLATAVGATGE